jgi:hypothetical protein
MSNGEEAGKIAQITADKGSINVFGTEIEIHPLDNKEFLSIVGKAESGSESEAILQLVHTTLKKDDPSLTREQLLAAPAAVFAKAMNEIEKVNGLEDFFSDDAKQEARNKQA